MVFRFFCSDENCLGNYVIKAIHPQIMTSEESAEKTIIDITVKLCPICNAAGTFSPCEDGHDPSGLAAGFREMKRSIDAKKAASQKLPANETSNKDEVLK